MTNNSRTVESYLKPAESIGIAAVERVKEAGALIQTRRKMVKSKTKTSAIQHAAKDRCLATKIDNAAVVGVLVEDAGRRTTVIVSSNSSKNKHVKQEGKDATAIDTVAVTGAREVVVGKQKGTMGRGTMNPMVVNSNSSKDSHADVVLKLAAEVGTVVVAVVLGEGAGKTRNRKFRAAFKAGKGVSGIGTVAVVGAAGECAGKLRPTMKNLRRNQHAWGNKNLATEAATAAAAAAGGELAVGTTCAELVLPRTADTGTVMRGHLK